MIYKKAGELVNYRDHSFENIYEIKKIIFHKKIHCYCRLGGDLYTNFITVSFNPGSYIPDYVYLDKAIVDRFEQTDSIIEEVLIGIKEIILNQCPDATDIHIESEITDSVPKDFPVQVEL